MDLKERRKALGYTQKYVAERTGCDQSSISSYESGNYKPKYRIAKNLADLYGCTVDDVMAGPDGPDNTATAVP